MERQQWTAHTFPVDIDPGWAENIVARLRGTAARLAYHTAGLDEAQCADRPNGKWSIKQHIGHLIDLEALHRRRLDEFAAMGPALSPADMSNARTEASDHNSRTVAALIAELEGVRNDFIQAYEALSDEMLMHQALHPRLKVPMRPVDLLFFAAEHDDHHIATVLAMIDPV